MALDDDGNPLVAVLEAHAAFFLLKGIWLGCEERRDADNVIIIGILVLEHICISDFPPEDLLVRLQAATRMDPVDARSHEDEGNEYEDGFSHLLCRIPVSVSR